MTGCDMCGNQGYVYRARVEGGRAIWNGPQNVPDVIPCPRCFLQDLTGA